MAELVLQVVRVVWVAGLVVAGVVAGVWGLLQ